MNKFEGLYAKGETELVKEGEKHLIKRLVAVLKCRKERLKLSKKSL
jgi:hypothetical protein